jgi:hypothetical protein
MIVRRVHRAGDEAIRTLGEFGVATARATAN